MYRPVYENPPRGQEMLRPGKLAQKQTQEDPHGATVLGRTGYSQADDQLLREDSQRGNHARRQDRRQSNSTGSVTRGFAAAVDGGDGGDAVHRLDLRPFEPARGTSEGGGALDAESDRSVQEEERQGGCAQNRRSAAVRSVTGMLYGSGGDTGAASDTALPQPAGAAMCADEESNRGFVDGDGNGLRSREAARPTVLSEDAPGVGGGRARFGGSVIGVKPFDRGSIEQNGAATAAGAAPAAVTRAKSSTTDEYSRSGGSDRPELGSGDGRTAAIFPNQPSHQLLWLVQRTEQLGRQRIPRPDFQETQSALAVGAGG